MGFPLLPIPLRSEGTAHLSLQNLTALAAADLQTKEDSAHAKNGKSRKRMKKVLSNGKESGCRCKQKQLGKHLLVFPSEETRPAFVSELPVAEVLAKSIHQLAAADVRSVLESMQSGARRSLMESPSQQCGR